LMRHRGKPAALVAGTGFLWAIIDHIANNYDVGDFFAQFLAIITINGYLTLTLFIVALVACIGLDSYINMKILPKYKEFKEIPKAAAGGDAGEGMNALWDFMLDRRRLAYAFYRYQLASPKVLPMSACVVSTLTQCVINHTKGKQPGKPRRALPADLEKTMQR